MEAECRKVCGPSRETRTGSGRSSVEEGPADGVEEGPVGCVEEGPVDCVEEGPAGAGCAEERPAGCVEEDPAGCVKEGPASCFEEEPVGCECAPVLTVSPAGSSADISSFFWDDFRMSEACRPSGSDGDFGELGERTLWSEGAWMPSFDKWLSDRRSTCFPLEPLWELPWRVAVGVIWARIFGDDTVSELSYNFGAISVSDPACSRTSPEDFASLLPQDGIHPIFAYSRISGERPANLWPSRVLVGGYSGFDERFREGELCASLFASDRFSIRRSSSSIALFSISRS